jgi:hypothetical protein
MEKIKTAKQYVLNFPSTSKTSGVNLIYPGGELDLRYEYYNDKDDEIYRGGIRFHKVRALTQTAEIYCSAWKIEHSYDTLVKIVNSPWVEDLRSNPPDDLKYSWEMNHYMIYFDSDGCYEIVAASWEVLPEEKVS